MTRLLLDTHALLFWLTDDARLSPRARASIAAKSNVVFVSAASAWEIATKHRLGRLPEATELLADFGGMVARSGFESLAISSAHVVLAGSLRGDHRDPFDRMLAAQSLVENVAVVTVDAALAALGARCIW